MKVELTEHQLKLLSNAAQHSAIGCTAQAKKHPEFAQLYNKQADELFEIAKMLGNAWIHAISEP